MADVSDSTETGVNQNNEVSSTKPELCDNGPTTLANSNELGSRNSPVKFGSGPVLGSPKNHFSLRSSVLGTSLSGGGGSGVATPGRSVPFVLNPPKLSNPFAKGEESKSDDKEKEKESSPCSSSEESNEKTPDSKMKCDNGSAKSSVSFVPLKTETPTHSNSSSCGTPLRQHTPSLGFVFGQNLRERVFEGAAALDDDSNEEKNFDASGVDGASSEIKTNGTTTEMLFTAGVKKEASDKTMDTGGKTLSEAAREYEEARAVKRKFEAVTVVTGEEEESNILQMNCKLFAFEQCTCNWVERGRGTLRLNDLPNSPPQSRLIVRAAGSLRLVLNTKIWAGMSVGRASLKSLRITAMDSSQVVRIFLIMASPKEIDQLQKALEWRVNNIKKLKDTEEEVQGRKSKPKEVDSDDCPSKKVPREVELEEDVDKRKTDDSDGCSESKKSKIEDSIS